jgi:hypothetical protein
VLTSDPAILEDVELAPLHEAGAAAAISSCVRQVKVETAIPVPAAAAARAVAHSPSRSYSCWYATGATTTGSSMGVPSTVVAVETSETSQRTRGRNVQRSKAARFARSVHSSPEPPARYAHGPGSSRSSARRS